MLRKFALDTNVIIDVLKGVESVQAKLVEATKVSEILIPPYCCYEMIRGFKDRNADKQLADFREYQKYLLTPQVDERAVMERSAETYIFLKKKGFSTQDVDIFIASWAIEVGATLVTANIKHFENIPNLKIENWKTR